MKNFFTKFYYIIVLFCIFLFVISYLNCIFLEESLNFKKIFELTNKEIVINLSETDKNFSSEDQIFFAKWIFFYLKDLKLFFVELQDFYTVKFNLSEKINIKFFKSLKECGEFFSTINNLKHKDSTFCLNIIRIFLLAPEDIKDEVRVYDLLITKKAIYVVQLEIDNISDSDFQELSDMYEDYESIKESGKISAFKKLNKVEDLHFYYNNKE